MKTSSLKRIANKYTQTSLILRILIGMAIGVVLDLLCLNLQESRFLETFL